MSICILKPGLQTTVQDAGRQGFQHLGINPGGAMDSCAMQTANALVLNDAHEAVLEFYFPAPVIRFNHSAFIALGGGDFSASVNGTHIPINQPVFVTPDSILQFNRKHHGQIGYLAIQGGLELDDWLNSYSTNLKAGAGGFEGRALRADDEIPLKIHTKNNKSGNHCYILPWKADTKGLYTKNNFRFIAGHEYDSLPAEAKTQFTASAFTIQSQSDRMGYRLTGPELQLSQPLEMISSAVTRGTVQLLPNGQCIILMADHQTTGGYPRIGHIISADWAGLAQTGAGESIQFSEISLTEAQNELVAQEQHLQQLKNACILQLDEYHRH